MPSYSLTNSLPLTAILILLFFKNENKKKNFTVFILKICVVENKIKQYRNITITVPIYGEFSLHKTQY